MTTPISSVSPPPLEMWAGIECSRVRIGEAIRDQLSLTGHDRRSADLERLAALGIKALRYPILWERHAADGAIDWDWADGRLNRLRELGIRPIVGFVHHGSGALPGGLVDPGFVDGLAAFARTVAERYPWIDAYTPINEPNTTARFSGLYGHWHPHGTDLRCYGECLMNECRGTRAAMKAIRAINPRAELVQTEDVGKTHSTSPLSYQADYENERRWITFDLLCGRIDRNHLVYPSLIDCGVSQGDMESLMEDPCPPDVIGMNYYVTSERFLDERMDRYPSSTRGGNDRDRYSDVDAVRVRAEGLIGTEGLLRELWSRYQRPIAITEVQLDCTRDEQLRWLVDSWEAAQAARAGGVDVRAITPWSVLGAFDWDSLLVASRSHYEPGAFDVRGPEPRCTAIGHAIRDLALTGRHEHPVLSMPGWWRRPVRLQYRAVSAPQTGGGTAHVGEPKPAPGSKPLVVLGARGTLGQAFLRLCELRGLPAVGLVRTNLDISDAASVALTLRVLQPWAVINCAGYVRVDDAEIDADRCRRENTLGAENLARVCNELGAKFATFSSDLVFDGGKQEPYLETDAPNPLNVYGGSKCAAERAVQELHPSALVVRTSAFFGPWDDANFAIQTARTVAMRRTVYAARDYVVSPTYVPDLVNATLDLVIDGASGIWHLANAGQISWFDWARSIADAIGASVDLVRPAEPHELGWIAKRPRYSPLGTARGLLLDPLERAMDRYLSSIVLPQTSIAA